LILYLVKNLNQIHSLLLTNFWIYYGIDGVFANAFFGWSICSLAKCIFFVHFITTKVNVWLSFRLYKFKLIKLRRISEMIHIWTLTRRIYNIIFMPTELSSWDLQSGSSAAGSLLPSVLQHVHHWMWLPCVIEKWSFRQSQIYSSFNAHLDFFATLIKKNFTSLFEQFIT
jgi:hypothetical protein